MSKRDPDKPKARIGRPPTGKNAMIAIRWPPPLLAGIDKYAQQQMLARPVALRQIVAMFLVSKGLVPRADSKRRKGSEAAEARAVAIR
jgi:hypothetical protein